MIIKPTKGDVGSLYKTMKAIFEVVEAYEASGNLDTRLVDSAFRNYTELFMAIDKGPRAVVANDNEKPEDIVEGAIDILTSARFALREIAERRLYTSPLVAQQVGMLRESLRSIPRSKVGPER